MMMKSMEEDKDDLVTIFGYGSLMDPLSTKSTMNSAHNFRKGVLHDYLRVFSLVSVSGIRNGSANMERNEIAALAIRPHTGCDVKGVLFDIPAKELAPYLEREHRYAAIEVPVDSAVGDSQYCSIKAWTVIERTDAEYRNSLIGGDEEYHQRVGQYYQGQVWGRHDILPMRQYLLNALVAAFILGGGAWLRAMLDQTFLADGVQTVRDHLKHMIDMQKDEPYIALLSRTRLNEENTLIDFIRNDRFLYNGIAAGAVEAGGQSDHAHHLFQKSRI